MWNEAHSFISYVKQRRKLTQWI
uniref:Uncharacterized protein n=1 Tax=Anguilla anguilla TaxID=7936 RepID=A0A0E9UDM0_ANGAN